MHYLYLFLELVSPNDCIVNKLDISTLIDETQIKTNHLNLSKIFLGDGKNGCIQIHLCDL